MDALDRVGVKDDVLVVVVVPVLVPAAETCAVKPTLSRLTVPPAAEASGLGASLTHKLPTLLAPAPRAVEPAVALPVDKYTADVPDNTKFGAVV